VFNVNSVNASLKRLFNLQYFSDVKAQPEPGSTPDQVIVTVLVTEQKTASISFGVGYGTQTGIEGFVGLKETNFGGNGQALSLSFSQTVLYGSSFLLAFHEPYFLGTRTIMDLQAFDTLTIPTNYQLGLNNQFQYDLTEIGAILTFTIPWGPIDSLSAGVKSVNSTFGNPLTGTNPPADFQFTPGLVNALILGAARDTRNDPILPTSGDRLTLNGEFAFQVLGGAFQFQKYEFDIEHFLPLGGDSTLVGHVHLGYSGTPMPIQEQFYLGGQTTLRGYPYGRFQGDELAVMQIEYRFPLSSLPFLHSFSGIQAILFVEGGDAEPAGSTQFTLHSDVGLGIQVKTPVGPFRMDFGVSNEGSQFWISSGAVF
jgi:outer membrane protein insertion porin family